MKIQLLSDLHLETEPFDPEPADGADLLVLAGDIDSTWDGLARFGGWPVPVVLVAGNHEFDGRDVDDALAGLAERCDRLGLRLLERDTLTLPQSDGTDIRLLGTVRWSDFDLYGDRRRAQALRAGGYFTRVMRATRGGEVFGVDAIRAEALACRAWLAQSLAEGAAALPAGSRTVVVTHFAPSLRSADPRYGASAATASFCNADDDLMPGVDLWLHGHLHCRHDYAVEHADGRRTRVVSQARGLAHKGETDGFDAARLIEV